MANEIPPKPIPLSVNFEGVPSVIRYPNQWVNWQYIWKEDIGKWDKPLFNPQGWKASATASHTWSPFTEVQKAYEAGKFDGVGFVMQKRPLTEHQLIGIDLDKCRNPKTGEISQEAKEDLDLLNSYSEISPSGTGIRVFVRGDISEDGRNNRKRYREIYKNAHYLTVTGQRLEEYPATIETRPTEVLEFYNKYFSDKEQEPSQEKTTKTSGLTDEQVIALASQAHNSPKFLKLMAGDWERFTKEDGEQLYPSQSEADLALCELLAFYTQNPEQIDRIFRRSKLYREKWERKDYAYDRTIKIAIDRTKEHYSGNRSGNIRIDFQQNSDKSEPISDLKPCDIKELLSTFKKWLHIEEDYNVTGPTCAAVANFCPGDPDIIGLIQPSGSIKTEFIRSLGQSENQYVYPLSSLTEHTLVSGHKDSRDLVPLLKGRMICIKDFTTILSKKEDVRSQIFADIRELTDGYIRKEFGNGIKKEYQDIHSSILFASTNAIERYYTMYSNLGQRLIFLRPRNDPKAARKRSYQNRGKQEVMRNELYQVMIRFLATYIPKARDGLPQTPEETLDEMGEFYDFLAIVRTPIHHDYRSGEIDELPESEFPTRIANTIGRLVEVHALLHDRDEVSQEDTNFGARIVLDNIPTMRWRILSNLSTEWKSTAVIAKDADLAVGAIRYVLDELFSLKLVERLAREEKDKSQDRRSDSYKLADEWAIVIEKLKTRISKESTTEEELNQIINKQNTVITNPCLLFCGNDNPTIGPHPRRDIPMLIRKPEESKNCASCPVALKGDKSAIQCDPCVFLRRAKA